jgi:hypothetical protein
MSSYELPRDGRVIIGTARIMQPLSARPLQSLSCDSAFKLTSLVPSVYFIQALAWSLR